MTLGGSAANIWHMTTLIGTAEAASELGIARSTLTWWVRAGKITAHVRNPRCLLFDRDEIKRFAAARKEKENA